MAGHDVRKEKLKIQKSGVMRPKFYLKVGGSSLRRSSNLKVSELINDLPKSLSVN